MLFTIMQHWAHTTLHTLLYSWTDYIIYSQVLRDQSRPGMSSNGTMLVFIGMLWSTTALQITYSSLYSTSRLTLHSGIQLKSCSLPGTGRSMTTVPINACLFYREWRRYVRILTRNHVSPRYSFPGDIFHWCLGLEVIACDIDEILWLDKES